MEQSVEIVYTQIQESNKSMIHDVGIVFKDFCIAVFEKFMQTVLDDIIIFVSL